MKISARDIAFGYGPRAVLDGVSLDVPEGRVVGLVGPNGAGKSTLLHCLHGALRPRRGTILVDDVDIATLAPREIARAIGVVPQSCSPTFPVSAAHFVGLGRFARELRFGGPSAADAATVEQCLRALDVAHLADRTIDELSGGEFRRVLIAQALAQEPSLLLFDEPVQQLDPGHQLDVMEIVRSFARRGGNAVVIVLHDLSFAARFCDELRLLHRGRIIASGSLEAVLTADNVRTAYGVEAAVQRCPATGALQVVPLARAGD